MAISGAQQGSASGAMCQCRGWERGGRSVRNSYSQGGLERGKAGRGCQGPGCVLRPRRVTHWLMQQLRICKGEYETCRGWRGGTLRSRDRLQRCLHGCCIRPHRLTGWHGSRQQRLLQCSFRSESLPLWPRAWCLLSAVVCCWLPGRGRGLTGGQPAGSAGADSLGASQREA